MAMPGCYTRCYLEAEVTLFDQYEADHEILAPKVKGPRRAASAANVVLQSI
jgi:hypothetical protein